MQVAARVHWRITQCHVLQRHVVSKAEEKAIVMHGAGYVPSSSMLIRS